METALESVYDDPAMKQSGDPVNKSASRPLAVLVILSLGISCVADFSLHRPALSERMATVACEREALAPRAVAQNQTLLGLEPGLVHANFQALWLQAPAGSF